nr:methyltransferase domain-containing protein [Candidatus Njordarchaeum guaymaensis]
MESDYLTDEEYKTYWYRLEGLRTDISKSLALKQGMRILDVGTGYALFAIEMAKQLKNGTIIGIDIVEDGIQKAKTLVDRADAAEFISIAKTDAVKLPFKDSCFDLATSFLGMRDIYMTRGRRGVRKTLEEMIRVVKPDGRIVLCITPPEDMGTEDQRIAVRLEGEIFGAKSLPKEFYTRIFRQNHIVFKATQAFLTHKKMTANQTRIEFMDGIRIARRIYGRSVPTFSSVWRKYGRKIETHGYGMYSRIVVLEGQKLR